MAEAGFNLTARLDLRDMEKLPRLLRETRQEADQLQRAMSTVVPAPTMQKLEAFGELTRSAVSGGVTPRMKQDIRSSSKEVVDLIKEVYGERRAEIDRQTKYDQAMQEARTRGRLSGLKAPFGTAESRKEAEEESKREAKVLVENKKSLHQQLISEEKHVLREINRARDEALRARPQRPGEGYRQPPRTLAPGERWASWDEPEDGGDGDGDGGGPPGGGPPGGGRGGREGGGRFGAVGRAIRGFGGGFARGLGIPLGFGAAGAGYLIGRGIVTQALADEELYTGLMRRVGTFEETHGMDIGGARQRMFNIAGPGGQPLLGPSAAAGAIQQFIGLGGIGGRGPGGRPASAEEEFMPAQTAAGVGYGMGIGANAGAEFFGTLARFGQVRQGAEGAQDIRKFAVMIGETIAVTGMRGRETEVTGAATQFMGMTLRHALLPPNVSDILDFQAKLVQGASREERAGVQGQMGLRMMSAAQESITGTALFPGMGAGLLRPMMLATMMQAGVEDPAEMEKYRAQGMFATLPNGQKLIDALMETAGPMIEAGGPGEVAAAEMFNMSIPHFRRFTAAIKQPGARGLAEEVGLGSGDIPDYRTGPMIGVLGRFAEGSLTEDEARKQLKALRDERPNKMEQFGIDRASVEWDLVEAGTNLAGVFRDLTHVLSQLTGVLENLPGGTSTAARVGIGLGAAYIGARVGAGIGTLAGGPGWGTAIGAGIGALGYLAWDLYHGSGVERPTIDTGDPSRRPRPSMTPSTGRPAAAATPEPPPWTGPPDTWGTQGAEGIPTAKAAKGQTIENGRTGERWYSDGTNWYPAESRAEAVEKQLQMGERNLSVTEGWTPSTAAGVPGTSGTPIGPSANWWEEAARDGIRFSFDPATVTIKEDESGQLSARFSLTPRQVDPAPSGGYHGPTQNDIGP